MYAVFTTLREALDFAEDFGRKIGRELKICTPRWDNATFGVIDADAEAPSRPVKSAPRRRAPREDLEVNPRVADDPLNRGPVAVRAVVETITSLKAGVPMLETEPPPLMSDEIAADVEAASD